MEKIDLRPLVRMCDLLKKSLTKLEEKKLDELGQMGGHSNLWG